ASPATGVQSCALPVVAVNQPPVLAPIPNQSVNEGQLLQFTVTATDPDGDALSFAGANLPTGATLTDNHNGTATFSWPPSFTQAGNYTNVMITVTDSGTPPARASQSFPITVGTVNRPPILAPIGNRTATSGLPLSITMTASDPDGGALSFAATNVPTGASFVDNNNDTWTLDWTPGSIQIGNFSVTVTVTDAGIPPLSASETFTITVGTVLLPSTTLFRSNRTATSGLPLSITMTASDPDGDALSFAATNVPTGASFVDNHNDTATFDWTPGSSQIGNFSVTVTVTDAGIPPLSASENFTITVGHVHRPPGLAPIGNQTATAAQPLSITMTASDPDGDALSFAATNVPTGASFVDNHNGTATFDWTPGSSQIGNFSVTVTVTDAGIPPLSASETFTITVRNA